MHLDATSMANLTLPQVHVTFEGLEDVGTHMRELLRATALIGEAAASLKRLGFTLDRAGPTVAASLERLWSEV